MLDGELRAWYESLPSRLDFSSSTIYRRKESFQLGALCLFHCAYHQTMCDLYRIGTPHLYKLRSGFKFPTEQNGFLRNLQWTLFREARTIAAVIAEGAKHGPRTISDSWLPTIAYDSNRIMLFYLTQVTDAVGARKKELVLSTIPYVQSNNTALKSMMSTNAVAHDLVMLLNFSFDMGEYLTAITVSCVKGNARQAWSRFKQHQAIAECYLG